MPEFEQLDQNGSTGQPPFDAWTFFPVKLQDAALRPLHECRMNWIEGISAEFMMPLVR